MAAAPYVPADARPPLVPTGPSTHGARGGESDASLRMPAVIPRTAWRQSELRQRSRVRHPCDGQRASRTRTHLTRSSHRAAGGGEPGPPPDGDTAWRPARWERLWGDLRGGDGGWRLSPRRCSDE
ncbi:conserved hypothetical protein [Leishmania mexicana MHOM/GT/2001/U1103]|uniref:Uncharacterized protein n=1 Tax=Leishmania mexicana (strain MHOM/GT/2001/U1103) TaxID=929439 RepID=E9AUH6_LEIMU|nr:conserved hypothetical protein [Leishmania mexicana MHOM/GT/2001/U1103]CBZ26604.1 conserved hypothetical protein [Leishmania mexicana MHOM/GT/2001/U1103]